MRNCELCKSMATVYCESDQASLCWSCDGKVHGANFLVARHSRNLLCHACQSPTPWRACGRRLGHTLSLCDCCVNGVKHIGEDDGEAQIGGVNDLDDEVEEHEDRENETEDDGNQGVPLLSSTQPPPAASPSSSEESVTKFSSRDVSQTVKRLSLKRMREDLEYSYTQRKRDSELTEIMAAPSRHWRDRRIEKKLGGKYEVDSGSATKNTVELLQHHRGIDLNALPDSSSLPM